MALRIRRLAALVGIVTAIAVACHEGAQGFASMHENMGHEALVVCILVFTALTALAIPPRPGLDRFAVVGELVATPLIRVGIEPVGAPARASPAWLQRFIR